MRQGYTYDDVLLEPKKSVVDSRSEVDISANLKGGVGLDVPVISSPMDSVTGPRMAQSMTESGGIGVIHRFCSVEQQVDMVNQVDGTVGAAVGISDDDKYKRASNLVENGVDFLCVDVAHAHMDSCLETVNHVSEYNIPIMAGTVATRKAAKDLANAGADMIRVGVGTGSSCTTRVKAGVGVPQITAIQESAKCPYDVSIVADGGIKEAGDIMKALMAGADAVIIGGLLGACEESLSPTIERGDGELYKKVRGMASKGAQEEYKKPGDMYIEGEAYLTPLSGTVEEKMKEFEKGIRSGISYCGGENVKEARENADFIEITANTVHRNGVHGG